MKKSFIVSYYFILQLCCISCFAMDLPKPIQNSIISIHDNNHPNAILGRKFIHSFMYKSLQNAKNDFDALEKPIQDIVWSYLNNTTQSDQNNNIDTITGPALLATVLKLPIEIIYEIFHQYDKNKNFSIAQYLTDHISIVKEVEALYGKKTIKQLCCRSYYFNDISVPISKQDALNTRLTREQWNTLEKIGSNFSKKQLQTLALVEDSIIKIIVDESNKSNMKKNCCVWYSYKETLTRRIYNILKQSTIDCICLIILPLICHNYITNPIWASCSQYQDQAQLNEYNTVKKIITEIDTFKSLLQSMNIAFKNEYFVARTLPYVPYYYSVSDYPMLLFSILPISLIVPFKSAINTYYTKEQPFCIETLFAFYVMHLFVNVLLFNIEWKLEIPTLYLQATALTAFIALARLAGQCFIYLSGFDRWSVSIYLPSVKSLKKFLKNLLEDDGIIIE